MLAHMSISSPAEKRPDASLAPVSGMKSSSSASSGHPEPRQVGGMGFRLDVGVSIALPPASHLPWARMSGTGNILLYGDDPMQ